MSIPPTPMSQPDQRRRAPPNRPTSRPRFTAYVALCAFAGLRRGEALGVQVGDIDFLARTLRVTRQLQRAKPADIETGKELVEAAGGITVIVRRSKYESERTIYLPDELIAILSEHVPPVICTGACSTRVGSPGTTWSTTAGARPASTPGSRTSCTTCGTTSRAG